MSVEFNVIPLSDFHFAKGKFDLRVPLIFDYFLSENERAGLFYFDVAISILKRKYD